MIMFDVGEDDNVVFAYPEIYEVKVCDPSEKLARKICREFAAVEITDDEKKEMANRRLPPRFSYDFPKFHSAFQGL